MGERIVEVLKQGQSSPITVTHQIVIIYAVTNNLLSDVAIEDIGRFEQELYEFMDASHDEVLKDIEASGKLSKENEAALRDAIQEFKKKFLAS